MKYLLLLALLLAAFFFYKGVRAGAYSDDRTLAGAFRAIVAWARRK